MEIDYDIPKNNISRIRALDCDLTGSGGFASIISGGINQGNVIIRLQASTIGGGFCFDVDIYGDFK